MLNKTLLALMAMTLISISYASRGNESATESLLASVVPKGINIDDYPDAKRELQEHIDACGVGVVEDQPAEKNRCQYRIRIDDLFLKPLKEKTGFIYDPKWAYENGLQWETPTKADLAAVPDQWDLSDYGEMIRIVKQNCGDCWAQASRANLEQLLLTHNGERIPLSTQTLISSCCNTGSCGGGYMTTPGWIVTNGLPILSRDPYNGTNSSCKFNMQTDKMDYKLMKAPYVGSSLNYSRAIRPENRIGTQVKEIRAMMLKYQSSAVVTISAISSSGGIVNNCSNINSGGNHMQDIVGWYMNGSDLIARVQNSWGTSHGQNGYTHIKWECGDGKLNRGLGRSARVGIIRVPLTCKNVSDAYTGPNVITKSGTGVKLGKTPKFHQTCQWFPEEGLDDPSSCEPIAKPSISTEYHLIAKTDCGESSAMVLVNVETDGKRADGLLNTPHGKIRWSGK